MNKLFVLIWIGIMLSGCCTPNILCPPHVVVKVTDCDRYEDLNPHFKKAFAFLKRSDLKDLKVGRYEIDGDNCWAMVQETMLTPFAGAKVEAHRKYIDIQAPISGPELIGIVTMDAQRRALPFDIENDCVLFDAPTVPVTLWPGEFAIFFPPDGAHAPGHTLNGEHIHRKLVIKVRNVNSVEEETGSGQTCRSHCTYLK